MEFFSFIYLSFFFSSFCTWTLTLSSQRKKKKDVTQFQAACRYLQATRMIVVVINIHTLFS